MDVKHDQQLNLIVNYTLFFINDMICCQSVLLNLCTHEQFANIVLTSKR